VRLWLAILALCAACYAPELAPCTVRCRLTNDCPSGFACLDDRFCHGVAGEALCACKPLRCEEIPGACGDIDDTCGGVTHCGGCTLPLECGAGGIPNVCGDPSHCTPLACAPDACGPSVDSCGNPRTCSACPPGKKCTAGTCVPCTPKCATGELACGDDSCDGSCGSCPDSRWSCHAPEGICCIRNGEHCNPFLEGCNCCPGLFCVNGICQPDTGCAMATDRSWPGDDAE